MVKITPNCLGCRNLDKIESNTTCGYLVYFMCDINAIRIYGNPELIICDDFESKEGSE